MRNVLLSVIANNNISKIDLSDNNVSYALHECIKNDYITGVLEHKNGNGKYKFNSLPHIMVTREGLIFIKSTAKISIIISNIFNILKGVWGFLLGIFASLLVAYISWRFGWL